MKYDVIIGALRDTIAALGRITEELSGIIPKKTEHSFEEVRGVLARLSAEGHTAEVKEILTSFGCQKLSDVKEADYEKVLQEADKICRR